MQINASETLLTSYEAEAVFGEATAFEGDYFLAALYRAIVLSHEPHDDAAALAEMCEILTPNANSQNEIESVMGGHWRNISKKMVVVDYDSSISDLKPNAEGWETFDSAPYYLNRYLSQVSPTKVFINRELHSVIAVVRDCASSRWAQAFGSMLLIVLPWYYQDKPSDDTIAFFKKLSLENKDISPEEAKACLISFVNEVAKEIDFRDIAIKRLVSGLADDTRIRGIEERQEEIATAQCNIRDLSDRLQRQYASLNKYQVELTALENAPPASDDGVREFFLQHKNITLDRRSGNRLFYHVIDTLEFYDEDEARTLFANHNSWVYRYLPHPFIPALRSLFVDKRGIIRVEGCFCLSSLRLVTPIRGNHYAQTLTMPNPHIYFHACSGGNGDYYEQYAANGEWELGVEQSIGAAKNWSVGDSTVGKEMMEWLIGHRHDAVCIYVTDGSPLDGVTPECKLVNFETFVDLITAKQKAESEANNG